MQWRYSLVGKVALWAFSLIALAVGVAAALALWLQSIWAAFLLTLAMMAPLIAWSGAALLRRTQRLLRALTDGVQSLRSRDFSIGIRNASRDELSELVAEYNALGDALRSERQALYQRELLLETVIQSSPLALVLTTDVGIIVYGNTVARQLLNAGRRLEGARLGELLESAPAPLREAMAASEDTLFTLEVRGEPEIFHLARREFVLNTQRHRLYLLKQLTREINAQEVATWKKVIRVISHELNNSLAPISSLVHSAKLMVDSPDPQLQRAFTTIEERVAHLHAFVAGYARFAKLPKPRIEPVAWQSFLEELRAALPFVLGGPLPMQPGYFDRAQLAQALLNIIKNATEAGSAPEHIIVDIRTLENGHQIDVRDRGSGMSENVLQQAVLPFYSTKSSGTGLGLALCREIVEAHGGRLHLRNREGGGAVVTLWLPLQAR